MAVPRHARRAAVHQEVARRVIVKTYGSFAVLDNTQHNTTLDDGSQAGSGCVRMTLILTAGKYDVN